MVMSPPRRPVADVVFLVEATSNLESSFSEIKSNYLGQILTHFNPACADDSDMAIDVSYQSCMVIDFSLSFLADSAISN